VVSWPASVALSCRFIKHHSRSHGNVQGLDGTVARNLSYLVTGLAHQAVQPTPLPAENQRAGHCVIEIKV